jgi:large subunit ribosomal protein L17
MPKMRHLSRDSAHRRALLRNLATSLLQHEQISTTWHKAKEAQRWVEKLITLGKRNTDAARMKAQGMVFDEQHKLLPKVFGELRERYETRAGGYTRVLRTESHKNDAAESAILSLVDGPRDIRFAMTAKAIARHQANDEPLSELTSLNMHKVTKFRKGGEEELAAAVEKMSLHQQIEQARMQEEFDEDQTRFEWVRGPGNKAGPGKVTKRWMKDPEPGSDPRGLVRLTGGRKKDRERRGLPGGNVFSETPEG